RVRMSQLRRRTEQPQPRRVLALRTPDRSRGFRLAGGHPPSPQTPPAHTHPQNDKPTPPALTGDTEETGTDLPTIVDPQAQARSQAITARDPGYTWPAFDARVRHIFTELQPAWSTLDLRRARPFMSDRLFQTWSFWIDASRRAGLANISEQARVTNIALVRVVSD